MARKDKSKGSDLMVRYYVVCIIDLLGQRQKLAGWSQLPVDGKPTPDFMRAMKDSVGTVLWFREKFTEFFNEFEKTQLDTQRLNSLSPQQRKLFDRFRHSNLQIQQFADTFVFFAPIGNEHGDRTVEPVFRIVSACCMAMLVSLAAKLPLRGAISIGSGAQLQPGSLYGPALVTAHHLESEIAESPRVVVDNELLRYLKGTGYSDEPMIEALSLKLAETCRSFLCTDSDNRLIVDFLGEAAKGISEGPIIDMVKPLYDFVCSEHNKYSELGNQKLVDRYAALRNYVTSRLPIWGVSP
jgi:hypothetical protein